MIKLYNADCREILKQLPKDKKYCIVTDPPFNVGYHYNTYKDNMKEEELYKLSFQLGIFPDRVVSWVYNSNTAKQHRDIAFFGIKPDFNKVKQPYKNLTDKRIQKRIAEGKIGCKLYDWWNINQVKNVSKDKTAHPCQMPLEVMKRIIGILPESYIYI